MGRMAKGFLATVCTLLVLTGCGGMLASKNSKALTELKVGDTQAKMVELLGQPKRVEATGNKQYWIYRTTGFASGEYDLYTPVLLVDGKVVGWGKQYFKDIGVAPEIKSQSSGGSSGGGVIVAAPLYNPPSMAPFMTNPSSVAPVRGNTQPFLETPPQQPIQNPSVNCNPNGIGGFRCQ